MGVDAKSDTTYTESRFRSVVRHDLPASLVVFLIAVPLSLGIAVASGAPLAAGLIAAVVGGVVAGFLGGSAVQVSGPAAGLSLVVADLVITYGWRATCMITLLAGALQLLLGLFRVARAALAVSPAVVHGMLAGVGAVIALAQLHVVLGGSPQRSAIENLIELPQQIIHNHNHAVFVGLLTIAVLVGSARLPQRLRIVPAPLAALLVASVTAGVFGWDVTRVDLSESLGEWATPIWPQGDWHAIVGAVLLVALLAGVESLLCSVATDKLHDGKRADLDRELTAQGVSNMVTGALGGLPVAGVIVRSSANARAGARSRWSTILHGGWILMLTVCLGWTIRLIPMEALAALLVFIGVQMINMGHLRNLRGHGEIPVYVVTMAGVVLLGLAEGVLFGLGLAALSALRRLTWITVRASPEPDGRWHVLIGGSLTFLGVPKLTSELQAIPAGAGVQLDLNIDFMDNAAFEAVHAWRQEHERGGGTVDIDEVHDEWYAMAASGARMFPAKTPPRAPERWWLPWAHRRRRQPVPEGPRALIRQASAAGSPAVPDLLAGAREFHRRTAPLVRPFLRAMARGQEPSHLFITCADSRVVPSLITASGPGDLFTVRNIGNLVPRRGSAAPDDSVAAAIEYATEMLNIQTITVCGHSGCGAMAALLSGGEKASCLPALDRWLRHGNHSLARFIAGESVGDDDGPLDRLCRVNVIQQLENLRTYPEVDRLVRAGRLQLVGLYFDIGTARVHVLEKPPVTASPL
ncbi:bifunctional SulP family inorganic anion transporter/carbonic anhydrase [Streptosporangium sp. NBC_01756]|uniref:bifunctional SulP family inorganic anion transporter/carbonic anhydrase n=1 Tax=Streptosporangium sp. NBC_01756 TaxID=2975950 RepID=UPI002DD7B981|nr:bifunctional SulP family inorganic anion transporter/carbonic anhydrase [Streptosporangium sp. NBC_01756]WSC87833.1 bifunctional SulP family inorganic anion transporter/carbonic anhydrase [Streptosporangium sp. NBC_01756]